MKKMEKNEELCLDSERLLDTIRKGRSAFDGQPVSIQRDYQKGSFDHFDTDVKTYIRLFMELKKYLAEMKINEHEIWDRNAYRKGIKDIKCFDEMRGD